MTLLDDKQLEQALRQTELDDEREARNRTLGVVRSAFAERPTPQRRHHRRAAVIVAILALATGAFGLSPAGADFRQWVSDTIDPDSTQPQPSLTSLPGGGSLLAQSGRQAFVVSSDGARRSLGRLADASWSPNGLFVVGADHNSLAAVEPDGTLRWSISAKQPVRLPAWSRDLGYRVAYLSGRELRVVAGDGTSDRTLGEASSVQPAWRNGSDQQLAFVAADNSIQIIDVDTSETLSRFDGPRNPIGIKWSARGELAAFSHFEVRLTSSEGALLADYKTANRRITDAAFLGSSDRIAVLETRERNGQTMSSVAVLRPRGGRLEHKLIFQTPGHLKGLAVSPEGDRILVGWIDADQWIFLDPESRDSVRAVGNVSRQFAPGEKNPAFPVPSEWCCSR